MCRARACALRGPKHGPALLAPASASARSPRAASARAPTRTIAARASSSSTRPTSASPPRRAAAASARRRGEAEFAAADADGCCGCGDQAPAAPALCPAACADAMADGCGVYLECAGACPSCFDAYSRVFCDGPQLYKATRCDSECGACHGGAPAPEPEPREDDDGAWTRVACEADGDGAWKLVVEHGDAAGGCAATTPCRTRDRAGADGHRARRRRGVRGRAAARAPSRATPARPSTTCSATASPRRATARRAVARVQGLADGACHDVPWTAPTCPTGAFACDAGEDGRAELDDGGLQPDDGRARRPHAGLRAGRVLQRPRRERDRIDALHVERGDVRRAVARADRADARADARAGRDPWRARRQRRRLPRPRPRPRPDGRRRAGGAVAAAVVAAVAVFACVAAGARRGKRPSATASPCRTRARRARRGRARRRRRRRRSRVGDAVEGELGGAELTELSDSESRDGAPERERRDGGGPGVALSLNRTVLKNARRARVASKPCPLHPPPPCQAGRHAPPRVCCNARAARARARAWVCVVSRVCVAFEEAPVDRRERARADEADLLGRAPSLVRTQLGPQLGAERRRASRGSITSLHMLSMTTQHLRLSCSSRLRRPRARIGTMMESVGASTVCTNTTAMSLSMHAGTPRGARSPR